jgi:hypothetical protein
MRTFFTLVASVVFFSTLVLAETWSGKLIDAGCVDRQKNLQACTPNSTTSAFLIAVNSKIYRLDTLGNAKAVEALRNRADRSATPDAPMTVDILAKISGTLEGDIIKVESLEVQ